MIVILGLIIGIVIGLYLPFNFSPEFSSYIAIAILAALDSIFGGINSILKNNFDNVIFVSGFFGNAIIAVGLAFLGVKLGVPIYLAAVIVFVGRLFLNFAIIRRHFVEIFRNRQKLENEVKILK